MIDAALADEDLAVLGAFHLSIADKGPKGYETLVLIGPGGTGFWSRIETSPEFNDGADDPVDRWSRRVIEATATSLSALALFPFGGPPYQPFIHWALRSGRAWTSPVGLLVHDTAGLMVSYRGALAFKDALPLPAPGTRPCDACADKPCVTACPVGALSQNGYNVAECHAFLDTNAGADCMGRGCAVRRVCPVSKSHSRSERQSAYHMRMFHK